jgi:hypothetical protein
MQRKDCLRALFSCTSLVELTTTTTTTIIIKPNVGANMPDQSLHDRQLDLIGLDVLWSIFGA